MAVCGIHTCGQEFCVLDGYAGYFNGERVTVCPDCLRRLVWNEIRNQ